MGEWFRFSCLSCSYTAEVSGGPDSGMLVDVQTMTCHDCRTLVDVVTAVRPLSDGENDHLGRCPKCKGKNLTRWGKGEQPLSSFEQEVASDIWGPCPECGGNMRSLGSIAIWD